MQSFRNILFISNGIKDEIFALKQALSLARDNEASLKILIIYPQLPNNMLAYKDKYEKALKEQIQNCINNANNNLQISANNVPITIELESSSAPAVRIIRHVIHHKHDLIIKGVEGVESKEKNKGKTETPGFKAIDMNLLRQCPCPIWLCRPIEHHHNNIKIAVAIDSSPNIVETTAYNLSIKLLTTARSLADRCSKELEILSCWNCELEDHLRYNPWLQIPESDIEIANIISQTEKKHLATLNNLIKKSNITGKIYINHIKGDAEQEIPKLIINKQIDILIMGTVARTGIKGFIIGNTAENIMQKLHCSLLAMKPDDFISPIKVD